MFLKSTAVRYLSFSKRRERKNTLVPQKQELPLLPLLLRDWRRRTTGEEWGRSHSVSNPGPEFTEEKSNLKYLSS